MSQDWQRIRSIFERAVELEGEAREAWLEQACGEDSALKAEVRELLAHDAAGDSLLDGGAAAVLGRESRQEKETVAASAAVNAGGQIGPYRLLERIGEGGMGEVWLAEQREPVRRRVALKIIRRGMDSDRITARFSAERQALALMEHASIATVFDAGTTPGGRPYFAMEYVAGVPITEHCDRERLTMRQRIELFMEVCEGVQHAHQKGVIHRDIKPSNVLVTMQGDTALPKIIDFGVAKATQQRLTEQTLHTELGMLVGTPEYMSPEQADLSSQDVDTRSDVYSLGVLLYELLVGALPFDSKELRQAGLDEIRRRIREVEPPTPSTRIASLQGATTVETAHARRTEPKLLSRQLQGELDWITMRALEKERGRRYGSPSELAADLQRHLDDEPVLAGPPSAAYRTGKFVRRHRLAVGAVSIITVSLIGFLITLAFQASQIAKQRDDLAASTARLERVVSFQSEQLSSVDPEWMGQQLRDSILDARQATAESAGWDTAEVDATIEQLRKQLAWINFTDIASETLGRNVFDPALNSIDTRFDEDPLLQAELLQSIASTMYALAMYGRAEAPQQEAVALRRRWLGDLHPDTLTSRFHEAKLSKSIETKANSRIGFAEIVADLTQVLGATHPDTLEAKIFRAHELSAAEIGTLETSVKLALEVVEAGESVLGQSHPKVIKWRQTLAYCAFNAGEVDLALRHSRQAYEDALQALGPEHELSVNAMGGLAGTLWKAGYPDEAEPLARAVWERRRVGYGDRNRNTTKTALNLAAVLESQNRIEEAEALVRGVVEYVAGEEYGPGRATALHNLGYLRFLQGDYVEAELRIRAALEERTVRSGIRTPGTIETRGNLAMVLARAGKAEAAETLAREALGYGHEAFPPEHPRMGQLRGQLGLALAVQRRHPEAERELLDAHRILAASYGERHERTQRVAGYLAELYEDWAETQPGQGHEDSAAAWVARGGT